MTDYTAVGIVQQWQDAANQRDIPKLLALSGTAIELIGPRGTAYGHQALSEWAQHAGATFTTLRIFARDERVVVAQHGEWRSLETGAVEGEADVASAFHLKEQHVVRLARYDTLEQALKDAGLAMTDEV